jgi:hypothetical protein
MIVRCGGGCVTPEVRFGSRSEARRKTRCCCCRSGKYRSHHRMLVMRRIANPSAIGETAVECRWPSWRRMSDAVGRGRTVRGRWTRHDGHGVRRRAARATVTAAGMTRISMPPGVSRSAYRAAREGPTSGPSGSDYQPKPAAAVALTRHSRVTQPCAGLFVGPTRNRVAFGDSNTLVPA